MIRWSFSRRLAAMSGTVAVLAIVGLFPLRLAMEMSGLEKAGIVARAVNGSIWNGRMDEVSIGTVPMGSVQMRLAVLPLLMGRARLDFERVEGVEPPLSGALTLGFNQRGIDDVSGPVATAGLFAPLPVNTLELEDVTVHFTANHCAKAEGRVKARMMGAVGGLSLTQGLSGSVACDGGQLLVLLASQSGLERLTLRIDRYGQGSADMRIHNTGGVDTSALENAGFRSMGKEHVLIVGRAP